MGLQQNGLPPRHCHVGGCSRSALPAPSCVLPHLAMELHISARLMDTVGALPAERQILMVPNPCVGDHTRGIKECPAPACTHEHAWKQPAYGDSCCTIRRLHSSSSSPEYISWYFASLFFLLGTAVSCSFMYVHGICLTFLQEGLESPIPKF